MAIFSDRRMRYGLLVGISLIISLLAIVVGRAIALAQYKAIILLISIAVGLPLFVWIIQAGKAHVALCALVLIMPLDVKAFLEWFGPEFAAFSLAEVAMLGLSIVVLFQLSVNKRANQSHTIIFIGFTLFILGGVIGLLNTTYTTESLQLWFRWCLLSTATFLIAFSTTNHISNARTLALVVVASALTISIITLLCSGTDILHWADRTELESIDTMWRVGGTLVMGGVSADVHPVTLGEYQAMGFILAFNYALSTQSRRRRFLWGLAALTLLGLFSVMSNSRAVIIAIIASLFLVVILLIRQRVVPLRRTLSLTLICLMVGGGSLIWWAGRDQSQLLGQRLQVLLTDPSSDYNFQGRQDLWHTFIDSAVAQPLGQGLYTGYGINTHNLYVQVLIGNGWMGLIGFLLVLGASITAISRGLIYGDRDSRCFFIGAIGLLVVMLISGLSSVFLVQQYKIASIYSIMGTVVSLSDRCRKEKMENWCTNTSPTALAQHLI